MTPLFSGFSSYQNINEEIINSFLQKNYRKREYREKPILLGFCRKTLVTRGCGMLSDVLKFTSYATKILICTGHFQRNLGMSFLNLNLINRIYKLLYTKWVYTFSVSVLASGCPTIFL